MSNDDFEVVRGSGNIFADFGDPDAQTKLMKAKLAAEIIAVLDARKLTVRAAAKISGITAADISRVRNADLAKFTLDRLVRLHHMLAPSVAVNLSFSPRASSEGQALAY